MSATPSFSSSNVTPAPLTSVPVQESADVSPLQKLGGVILKGLGAKGTAIVLQQISAPHVRLDSTKLVLDLKRPDVRAESVRELAKINLAFILGVKNQLEYAEPLLRQAGAYPALPEEISRAVESLRRDLTHPICRAGSEIILVDRMNPDRIQEISRLSGLPAIASVHDVAAYQIILAGSGIGAAIQASRQKRTFGLTNEFGGGAEFVGGSGKPMKQGAAFIGLARRLQPLFREDPDGQLTSRTAVQIMTRLAQEFEQRSAQATWL